MKSMSYKNVLIESDLIRFLKFKFKFPPIKGIVGIVGTRN